MKLTFAKFLELNQENCKIFYVEKTSDDEDVFDNNYFDAENIENDDAIRNGPIEKDIVLSYKLADDSDVERGALLNSLCVVLLATETRQKQKRKMLVRKVIDISLYRIINNEPVNCEKIDETSIDSVQTIDDCKESCPFNKDGHCIWQQLLHLTKYIDLNDTIQLKKAKK